MPLRALVQIGSPQGDGRGGTAAALTCDAEMGRLLAEVTVRGAVLGGRTLRRSRGTAVSPAHTIQTQWMKDAGCRSHHCNQVVGHLQLPWDCYWIVRIHPRTLAFRRHPQRAPMPGSARERARKPCWKPSNTRRLPPHLPTRPRRRRTAPPHRPPGRGALAAQGPTYQVSPWRGSRWTHAATWRGVGTGWVRPHGWGRRRR
jgi:hypothetical protein